MFVLRTPRPQRPLSLLCAVALASALMASPLQARAQEEDQLRTASHEELEIVKVLLAQEKAWNVGDIPGYIRSYKDSPDTIFMGGQQISRGYAQIAEDYKRNYPNRSVMGLISFSQLEAHSISENFAVCLGHYHLERGKRDGGPVDGMFSLVLEKTPAGWKIILDHTD